MTSTPLFGNYCYSGFIRYFSARASKCHISTDEYLGTKLREKLDAPLFILN